MAKRDFTVEFTFTSTKAYGDDYTLRVTIRARNAKEAEDTAWMQRVSFFGARGNDNAIDCRTIPAEYVSP